MLTIVKFCAEEVERQGRTALQVPGMVEAWLDALKRFQGRLTEDDILRWGKLIEDCNINGYRTVPVRVGSRLCPDPNVVPRMMDRLVEYQTYIPPDLVYRDFEEIHPFLDGNGRVGALLFNYLSGTLDNPIRPPDFWDYLMNKE